MKSTPFLVLAMSSVALCAGCSRSDSPTSTTQPIPASSISTEVVDKSWAFKFPSTVVSKTFTATLHENAATDIAPFTWTVTVEDSDGKSLLKIERHDGDIEELFNPDVIDGCKDFKTCKNKWYFEDLPAAVSKAVESVDQSNQPVEDWQRDGLKQMADDFLTSRGVAPDQREAVIEEMLRLLGGRFDQLHILEHPLTGTPVYMYVPSLGYFVPYYKS